MKKAVEVSESEVLEESEDAETRSSSTGSDNNSQKPHVEFKEPTVIDTIADIKVVNKVGVNFIIDACGLVFKLTLIIKN